MSERGDYCPECGANRPEDQSNPEGPCDNEFHGEYALFYRERQLEKTLKLIAEDGPGEPHADMAREVLERTSQVPGAEE